MQKMRMTYGWVLLCCGIATISFADMPVPHWSSEELAWLQQQSVLRILVGNYPPFMMEHEGASPTGVYPDLFAWVPQLMGIEVEYVPTPFLQSLAMIQAGEIDVLPGLFYSRERDQFLDFTHTHGYLAVGLFGLRTGPQIDSIFDLNEQRVGSLQASWSESELTNLVSQVRLVRYQRTVDLVRALLAKDVDFVVFDEIPVRYFLREYDFDNQVVLLVRPFCPQGMRLAVQKNNRVLVQILNKFMGTLERHGVIEQVWDHWTGVKPDAPLHTKFPARWILVALAGGLGVLVLLAMWNRLLRQQVQHRTRDLQRNARIIQEVVMGSPYGVAVFNQDGEVTLYNQVYADFFGGEVLSPHNIRTHPLYKQSGLDVERVYQGEKIVTEPCWFDMNQFLDKAENRVEERMHLVMTGFPIPEHDEKILHIVLVVADHTPEQERAENIQMLYQIACADSSFTSIKDLVNHCLSVCQQYLNPDMVGIYLVDRSSELFRLSHCVGVTDGIFEQMATIPMTRDLLGELLTKQTTVSIKRTDLQALETTHPFVPLKSLDFQEVLFNPLCMQSEIIGVVLIATQQRAGFSAAQKRMLDMAAHEIALTLHNLVLLEALQHHSQSEETQRRNLQTVTNTSPNAMLLVDEHDVVSIINHAMCKFFDISHPQDYVGKSFEKLLKGIQHCFEDYYKVVSELHHLTLHPETTLTNLPVNLKEPEYRELEVYSAPVPGEFATATPGRAWIMRDVTQERYLSKQLEHAQKMETIGTLAGGVAHDFNNVLTGITGNVSLARMKIDTEHPAAKFLERIDLAAERATNLTQSLLSFSRRTVGEVLPCHVNDLVNETINLLRQSFPASISLVMALDPQLWGVEVDATQIQQVIMNLCINARDAMPEGGTLTVSTKNVEITEQQMMHSMDARRGRHVQLEITDTGTGMTPELVSHIFEPFFTTKGIGEGTGLGLSMVYGLVRSHHGWVEVDSTVDVGSTFHVFLPVSDKQRVGMVTDMSPASVGYEAVLVVDDDEIVIDTVRETLLTYGYQVYLARDGYQALETYQQTPGGISVVLLDLTMPRMGGLECLQRLREIDPAVRVVLTTGYAEKIEHLSLAEIGAVDFLMKPYRPDVLVRMIRRALEMQLPPTNKATL